MSQPPFETLARLKSLRGGTALVFCTNDADPKPLAAADLPIFARVAKSLRGSERLDLILHTEGGGISAARALGLRLRECAPRFEILVPQKARSAGTLLCLAADALVLGAAAEFGPIDPQISADAVSAKDMPAHISAEDMRAFREMTEAWFGLKSEESRVQALSLLLQRVFPTSLARFYRADRYIRRAGEELLARQLPDQSPAARERIVDRLVSGHAHHDDVIIGQDILKLGLRAGPASDAEEALLEEILSACQVCMRRDGEAAAEEAEPSSCRALIFSAYGGFKFMVGRPRERPAAPGAERESEAPPRPVRRPGRWFPVQPGEVQLQGRHP